MKKFKVSEQTTLSNQYQKFLCFYGLALSKSVPLKGGYVDAQLDERCEAGCTMMALPVKKLLKLLYPSFIRIDEYLLKPSAQADDFKNIMKRLPLVAESLDSRGLHICDDGFRFVIWFGRMLWPDIARNLLGPEFDAELSRVRSIVDEATLTVTKLLNIIRFVCFSDFLRIKETENIVGIQHL